MSDTCVSPSRRQSAFDAMELNYHLTTMTAEHVPQIAELEKLCFPDPWSEKLLADMLWNDAAVMVVAEADDGTVLGYAGLQVVLDEGYIDNIAVHPDFRRRGIAGELLGAFIRFGQANLAFLTLEVRASNDAAIALYGKYGFQQVGRRKNYYEKPREDAILMTRTFVTDGHSTDQ